MILLLRLTPSLSFTHLICKSFVCSTSSSSIMDVKLIAIAEGDRPDLDVCVHVSVMWQVYLILHLFKQFTNSLTHSLTHSLTRNNQGDNGGGRAALTGECGGSLMVCWSLVQHGTSRHWHRQGSHHWRPAVHGETDQAHCRVRSDRSLGQLIDR